MAQRFLDAGHPVILEALRPLDLHLHGRASLRALRHGAVPALLALIGAAIHSLAKRWQAPFCSFFPLPIALFAFNATSPSPPSLKWQLILLLLLAIPPLLGRHNQGKAAAI